MFFDDRLATVLRQRASDGAAMRTQFRQLLDILGAETGKRSASRDPSLIASAWLRMDALAMKLPSDQRARIIREAGWRFRNPELAAHLADFEPDVASAALNRARLSVDEWTALIPRLPVRARGFLRLRKDLPLDVERLLDQLGVSDRGLPSPLLDGCDAAADREQASQPDSIDDGESSTEGSADEPPVGPPVLELEDELPPLDDGPVSSTATGFDRDREGRSEISALVERIAQFRRNREAASDVEAADKDRMPRLPLGEEFPTSSRRISDFGFAADAAGRIEWADAEVAAMVIGTRLIARARIGSASDAGPLERAFTRRQPITQIATALGGADAIGGDWIVDAQPHFTDDGNFSGYVGRFRRPVDDDPARPTAAQREADRIRQLLHELRTPVTAVQGYAEVIQQQLFGTAPHEYRALAAAIAADAAHILAGFEELDRLAKIETGAIEIDGGETDLSALTQRTLTQLAQVLGPRMAGIELAAEDAQDLIPHLVALDPDEAEGLLWRLLATLGGGCAAGELLDASLDAAAGFARLECELPAQLLAEEDVFTAEAKPIGGAINAGLFGAGFALRLARAEARSVGGDLIRGEETLVLSLPLAQQDHEGEMGAAH